MFVSEDRSAAPTASMSVTAPSFTHLRVSQSAMDQISLSMLDRDTAELMSR